MTRIFDNIVTQLGPHLAESIQIADRLDAAVGYFNLRGWAFLGPTIATKPITEKPFARILVGMATVGADIEILEHLQTGLEGDDHPDRIDAETAKQRRRVILEKFREQLMRGVPTEHDMKTLRQLRAQLVDERVVVKLFTQRPLHGKTYICHRQDLHNPITAFVGSSNLTLAGLRHNFELNVDVLDDQGTTRLADWFEERWDDNRSIDISADLVDLIDESWAGAGVDPYDVYLKVCWHLSRDVRDGLAEYSIPPALQSQLLEYQAQAVKTLARRIETRGGAMLGDVVGLGKSITAIAVAAMLNEVHEWDTLVICPVNLTKMWREEYLDEYEIPGRVVPYTMAARELPTLRRFRFVIIDESHTMRNRKRQDYVALSEYIRRNDCKVLLLTATPYNIRFGDVANQLGLYIDDDDDLGLEPLTAMQSDPGLAEVVDFKTSTLAAFRRSEFAEDWKRLMSDHLVRRTRSFIRANYAVREGDREYLTFSNGEKFFFPKRVASPIQHDFSNGDPAGIMASNTTLDTIAGLHLPRYGLSSYVDNKQVPNSEEMNVLDSMKTASGHLRGFVRTGLYKRLSSCGFSYLLSLGRHIARNEMWLYALDNELDLPVGTILDQMLVSTAEEDIDPTNLDEADMAESAAAKQAYEALAERPRPKVNWIRPTLFTNELRKHLDEDTAALKALVDLYGEWDFRKDSKIRALYELVTTQHGDEKVLVFTEYADTANYVAEALAKLGVNRVRAVTGANNDPTALARRFSPESNRKQIDKPLRPEEEIRVLVATDVLSEGQNLQDAHIVVNFDLPWAIIRLIQRAGRVDRVGQKAATVRVYSYFHENVEEVLNLRDRIRERLERNAEAFGSDEKFFGSDKETAIIRDLYDGSLAEDESEDDNDASSIAYEIWMKAVLEDRERAERVEKMPDMVWAIRPTVEMEAAATGVYVRTRGDVDGFGLMVDDSARLMTGHEALQFFSCDADTPGLPLNPAHFDAVQALVRGPLKRPQVVAGRLRGVRVRVWNRLNGDFATADPLVAEALDALYQRPLTGEAEQRLKIALRASKDDELASLVKVLYEQERLVIAQSQNDPVRIVCSMGVASAITN